MENRKQIQIEIHNFFARFGSVSANLDWQLLSRDTENAPKDVKSAIIKLEKEEVKTLHWWANYLFSGIGVLYWHISSALKSIGYIKACGLVKRVICLSLLNQEIWTYIFSFFAVWRIIQNLAKTMIMIFVADLEVFFLSIRFKIICTIRKQSLKTLLTLWNLLRILSPDFFLQNWTRYS